MKSHVYLLTKDQKLIKEVQSSLPENVELTIRDEAKSANGADAVLLDVDSLGISALNRLKNESFTIIVTAQKGSRYLIESMTFGAS
jgi:histidinol dehydrogenase